MKGSEYEQLLRDIKVDIPAFKGRDKLGNTASNTTRYITGYITGDITGNITGNIKTKNKSMVDKIIRNVKRICICLFFSDISMLDALRLKLRCSKSEVIRRALSLLFYQENKLI